MAAPITVTALASTTQSKRSNTSSESTPDTSFGETLSRELNRPAEQESSAPNTQNGKGQSDEQAQTTSEETQATATVTPQVAVDPLLLSLQMAMAQLPQQVAETPVATTTNATEIQAQNRPEILISTAGLLNARAEKTVATTVPTTSLATDPLLSADGKTLPDSLDTAASFTSLAGKLDQFLNSEQQNNKIEEAPLPTTTQLAPISAKTNQVGEVETRTNTHVVSEPVNSNRWGEVVAQRVSLMLGRQEQQLEMQLNPPHLGPMEVRLSLGSEQASIVFSSQHASVREALAAATPRLTALLADQGITLTNVQVASDSLNQHFQRQAFQQNQSGRSGSSNNQPDNEDYSVRELGELRLPVARSGISFYA